MAILPELPTDQRKCPGCGGSLTEMADQAETSERITTELQLTKSEIHLKLFSSMLWQIWYFCPTTQRRSAHATMNCRRSS